MTFPTDAATITRLKSLGISIAIASSLLIGPEAEGRGEDHPSFLSAGDDAAVSKVCVGDPHGHFLLVGLTRFAATPILAPAGKETAISPGPPPSAPRARVS